MHSHVFPLRSAIALVALTLSASAFAAQDAQPGQTVFKDKATGQLRNPTAAEAKQLNDLRAADLAARKAERKAAGGPATGVARLQQNGIVAAHVGEESMMYTVMRRNADGTLEHDCVHGQHAAESVITMPVSNQSKEHKNEVQ